jgi:hypothetical protein
LAHIRRSIRSFGWKIRSRYSKVASNEIREMKAQKASDMT